MAKRIHIQRALAVLALEMSLTLRDWHIAWVGRTKYAVSSALKGNCYRIIFVLVTFDFQTRIQTVVMLVKKMVNQKQIFGHDWWSCDHMQQFWQPTV